jgi:DNA-binding beta-propeller fold protein YncE
MRLRIVTALALLARAAASPADAVLTPAGSIALPGVTDAGSHKFDHSVLVADRWLFLAAKCNDSVAVVDLQAAAFASSTPVPAPQGMAYSAALGLVFAASSSAGRLFALSASPPFAVAWSVSVGADADNVRARDDAASQSTLVYVAHGGGASGNGAVTAVAATLQGGAVVGSVDVGADHPEELNLSPLHAAVSVSVPNSVGTGGGVRVFSTLPGAGYRQLDFFVGGAAWAEPYAQRLDASGTRLWLATAGSAWPPVPSQMLALNALDGSVLFAAPTGDAGGACDDIAVDGDGGLVFCAKGCDASRLYVVQQTRADALFPSAGANWTSLGALSVASAPQALVNARGLAWRASTRTLYLVVPPAGAGQQPQLLAFAAAGGSGGGAASTGATAGPLSVEGWSALTAGVALISMAIGGFLARSVGFGGAKEEPKEDKYASLN